MNSFSTRLRQLRQMSSTENGEKITQKKMGELLGQELGSSNFSNVTISNWENGQTSINKDDRLVLLSLLKIFLELNTINSINDCNEFLWLGNFRALDEEEIIQLNLKKPQQNIINKPNTQTQESITPSECKWAYVFPKNPYYNPPSRTGIMDDLIELLLDPLGVKVINICGIGGIGKTAFTLEIARRVIEQGNYSGLFGDCASGHMLVGDEILPVRDGQFTSRDLWNSLARQFDRNDLINQDKYIVAREILSQSRNDSYIFLIDGIECMENHHTLFLSTKMNLGNHRVILTSRLNKPHPDCRNIKLTSLPIEDTYFFLEHKAIKSGKEKYLTLLHNNIDKIMDTTGGIPIILQYILEKITFIDLEKILDEIKAGTSPFYDYVYGNEWQQLNEECQKYLINKAKGLQQPKDNFQIDGKINKIINASVYGFIEHRNIKNKNYYFFNPFTYNYLLYKGRSFS